MKNKKYKLVETYYYDYHQLLKSIETSKLLLESYRMELASYKQVSISNTPITKLTNLCNARKKVIEKQKALAKEMQQVIENFPKRLNNIKYIVYKKTTVEGKSALETAAELNYTPQYIFKIKKEILDNFQDYLRTTEQ